MGRVPCCEKDNVKRGQWTPEEDNKLSSYIAQHGTRNWRLIPKNAGLQRCGKSCRLRWTNYLRPDLKREEFTEAEEQVIIKLHSVVGNRWSLIAAQLPGRTDNDVKNHWNTKLKKKLSGMGIDPVTHKPFSHLMAEITTTLAPPQVAHLAEAALGCFKDEMLHLLTKNRVDLMAGTSAAASGSAMAYDQVNRDDKEGTIQRIKLGLSRAMQETSDQPSTSCKQWALLGSQGDTSDGFVETSGSFLTSSDGFVYGAAKYRKDREESAWSQSTGTASTCTGGAVIKRESRGNTQLKGERDDGEEANDEEAGRKDDFETDCVLWDLADDLIIE